MPNKFEENLKKARTRIFKNLTWILIVLSLLCFIISLNDIFSPRVNSILDKAGLGMLNKLKSGSKTTIQKLKDEGSTSQKFNKDNFDLITWFIIS